NTVPFDLAPHDGTVPTTVRVVRPLDAAELDLETTYENFHPSQQSLTNVISHFISGERPQGIQETEEMLRLGAKCGHVCACEECYRALPEPKKCPICRARIDRIVLLYNS
uniref:RING-type E3 ubiquitin transferase n=1 Tax=Sinocyclocheilus rhinocerous TaxID=307959 RepID=A0A673LX05_9TELE